MKNILLACFFFPPYSHSGVQRPLKFAKYLPCFGYQPIILTCGNMCWDAYDYETYESEVLGKMTVYQVAAPRYAALNYPLFSSKLPDRLILKLETLLFEDRLDWSVGVRKQAVRLIDKHRIQAVFTTGPPHSVHFLGHYLKRKEGIPWIMDYRDPLIEHRLPVGVSGLHRFLHRFRNRILFENYQRIWVKTADAVTAVTTAMTRDLRSQYPRFCGKIHTVTNGFDEKEFASVCPKEGDSSKLHLVYTGRLTPPQSPVDFLTGLRRALEIRETLKSEVEVLFIGAYECDTFATLTVSDLQGIVKCLGPTSHRQAVAYQMGSDANLLILTMADACLIPGKLFEYIRAGRPILALVPNGETHDIISRHGLGVTVRPCNHEGIAEAILKLHTAWKKKSLAGSRPSPNLLRRYDRRMLAQKLAMLADECFRRNPEFENN